MKEIKPILNFVPEVLLKAQEIKIVFFSFDGIITNGMLSENSSFYAPDIYGLQLLLKSEILPVIIDTKNNNIEKLARFNLRHRVTNLENADKFLRIAKISWNKTACMTIDWQELRFMQKCQFSFVPKNAHQQNKDLADFVSDSVSGRGATRQFCDLLLVASNKYKNILNQEVGNLN